MNNGSDKTVVLAPSCRPTRRTRLRVEYAAPDGDVRIEVFDDQFVIGRDPSCQVQLVYDGISRKHLAVVPEGPTWYVRDLGSSNGTYLNGTRVQTAALTPNAVIEFFSGGPKVRVTTESQRMPASAARAPSPPSAFDGRAHLREQTAVATADRLQKKNPALAPATAPPQPPRHSATHRRHFILGMSTMALLFVPAITYLLLVRGQSDDTREIAKQIFYQTKALELQLSVLRSELAQQPDKPIPKALIGADEQLRSMRARYSRFIEEKKLIGGHRPKEDLLIFRMARIFGEYDLNIPDDFLSEVKRYIKRWQQSNRLADSIARISAGNYAALVAREMRKRDLPPHFLYLAIQESNFRQGAIGPNTRFGIAKGIWQFIPTTAQAYGLRIGPKKDERTYDPLDERFNVEKATSAAAEYLRFLYTTEAQASGLLVMSAYNWGEGNIARALGRFPDNPAERNFWRLLDTQRIPDETYGYVLSILSAAVIGEDPQHFGFDFENPLKGF